MLKKIFAALLCLSLLCFVGCGEKDVNSAPADSSVPEKEPEPIIYVNPLTGVQDITDEDVVNRRPVAVMINNVSVAQKVQTGLNLADIVYETEVEGGITRLMAVFKDITKAKKFGTVRSARYPYVDLAMGHDAIYVHHGQDPTYCKPHLKDTQAFTLDTNNAGERIKNGLATEHTLYGHGDKLWEYFKTKTKLDLDLDRVVTWQNFASSDKSITFENAANTVNVPFSTAAKSVFKYDTESGKYVRYSKDTLRTDYVTGESEYFKNNFVLKAKISDYPDGYHRKVALTSGEGFYCVNGTYTPILWSKGAASNSFKFTDTSGQSLQVNQGNSWVCIADIDAKVSFEGISDDL